MTDKTATEAEFKWGIASRDELRAFVDALGGQARPPLAQTNHFFDTRDLALLAHAHTFRVREEDQRYMVTLKGPAQGSGNLTIRPEVEWQVRPGDARTVLDGTRDARALVAPDVAVLDAMHEQIVKELLAPAAGQPLERVGSFENQRVVIDAVLMHAGRELPARFEVDTVVFTRPGEGDARAEEAEVIEEYEVELEIDAARAEDYENAVAAVFDAIGIEPMQRVSKARRFFDLIRAG